MQCQGDPEGGRVGAMRIEERAPSGVLSPGAGRLSPDWQAWCAKPREVGPGSPKSRAWRVPGRLDASLRCLPLPWPPLTGLSPTASSPSSPGGRLPAAPQPLPSPGQLPVPALFIKGMTAKIHLKMKKVPANPFCETLID